MTRAEAYQAMEDETWCITDENHLVRIISEEVDEPYMHLFMVSGKGEDTYLIGCTELRIATPNDMLKYGE